MKCGAVIVENRAHVDVQKVIDDHMQFLPDDWGVMHIKDVVINEQHDYNRLLGTVAFWEQIPFDKILIFQQDSGLLRKGIEEFMEWDYVGAPFTFQKHGGNGGLSLRTKKVMIDTLKLFPYSVNELGNEDVYFSNYIEKAGGKLAPFDVCEKFSTESIFKLGTLGHHRIDNYFGKDHADKIRNQYKVKMKSLEEKFEQLCKNPSDINEHLPVLREYASKCDHITEMGVRTVISTYAFLMGRPKTLIGYDIEEFKDEVAECKAIAAAAELSWEFIVADVLEIEIEPTDFLFIDTFHTAIQLERELKLHADKAKKFIGFHDTATFWNHGETAYHMVSGKGTNCGRGLKEAIEPFLATHPEWTICYKAENNNGLTIIERI